MSFRTFGFVFLLVSPMGFAQGRRPAVEDFVGIEVEQTAHQPQGTEGLFNFEQDMQRYEAAAKSQVHQGPALRQGEGPQPSTPVTIFALTFFFGLPMLLWSLMVKHLRQKARIESASNIEVLENYRKQKSELKKEDEEIRKSA